MRTFTLAEEDAAEHLIEYMNRIENSPWTIAGISRYVFYNMAPKKLVIELVARLVSMELLRVEGGFAVNKEKPSETNFGFCSIYATEKGHAWVQEHKIEKRA